MALYLHLFHGREDPDEAMDDWGINGPTFGPFESMHSTYAATIVLFGGNGDKSDLWLKYHDDLVYFDGVYYGDFVIRTTPVGEPLALRDVKIAQTVPPPMD